MQTKQIDNSKQLDSSAAADSSESPRWHLFVYGLAVLLIGALLLLRPVLSIVALVQVVAIFWVVNGALGIGGAISRIRDGRPWGAALAIGVLGLVAGVFILGRPLLGAFIAEMTAIYAAATLALIGGAVGVASALRHWSEGGAGGQLAAGALSIVFAVVVFAAPLATLVVMVTMSGAFAVASGVAFMLVSFIGGSRTAASPVSGSGGVGQLAS